MRLHYMLTTPVRNLGADARMKRAWVAAPTFEPGGFVVCFNSNEEPTGIGRLGCGGELGRHSPAFVPLLDALRNGKHLSIHDESIPAKWRMEAVMYDAYMPDGTAREVLTELVEVLGAGALAHIVARVGARWNAETAAERAEMNAHDTMVSALEGFVSAVSTNGELRGRGLVQELAKANEALDLARTETAP